jgi:hypothetical protein
LLWIVSAGQPALTSPPDTNRVETDDAPFLLRSGQTGLGPGRFPPRKMHRRALGDLVQR